MMLIAHGRAVSHQPLLNMLITAKNTQLTKHFILRWWRWSYHLLVWGTNTGSEFPKGCWSFYGYLHM